MKTSLLVLPAFLAAFALTTGVSYAAECGEGHIQNAKQLGVDPTVFGETDLAALDRAMSENDATSIKWIKESVQGAHFSGTASPVCELPASN